MLDLACKMNCTHSAVDMVPAGSGVRLPRCQTYLLMDGGSKMLRAYTRLVAVAGCCTVIFAGCAGHGGWNNIGLAATQPPAAPQAAPQPANAPPYTLSAQCSGPMVRFKLQNLGDSDLQIQNKDFALVVPGASRKVIPYSNEAVSVDLPMNTIPPHQTMEGRAVFNDNAMPSGCRLVFKPYSRPDDKGTYAEISAPSGSMI